MAAGKPSPPRLSRGEVQGALAPRVRDFGKSALLFFADAAWVDGDYSLGQMLDYVENVRQPNMSILLIEDPGWKPGDECRTLEFSVSDCLTAGALVYTDHRVRLLSDAGRGMAGVRPMVYLDRTKGWLFPGHVVVPWSAVRASVVEFQATGKLPQFVDWQAV